MRVIIIINLIGIIISSNAYAQKSIKKDIGNYYWMELNGGSSSIASNGFTAGMTANVAIKNHLFSGGVESHSGPISFFCGNGEPVADIVKVSYGRIKKYRFGFLYAKGGLGFGNYHYVIDVIPATGWFGCDDYIYSKKFLVGFPLEVGASTKWKVVMLGAFLSVYLSHEPMFGGGIRMGLGDFM